MKRFYTLFLRLCVLAFLFLAPKLPAIPINDSSLGIRGTTAVEARLILLATAETYLGVPYRFGGADRRGMDCSGFVYVSFREALRYTIPRTSLGIYNWAQKIPVSELQPGDLVFFVTVGARVSHLGIYIGGGRFIHSASDGPHTGVIISRLDESFWRRTFWSAGRALPWDNMVAREMASARGVAQPIRNVPLGPGQGASAAPVRPPRRWDDEGFFAGFGASWNWAGGGEGVPTPFRGISTLITAGYAWGGYRLGLELRPQYDHSLGIFRLPFTVALGTDRFQVFAGPAYTFGTPAFTLSYGERRYIGGWLWEFGFSSAFPPIRIGAGALFIFGEMAWQSYRREEGQNFRFRPDLGANLRVSTGIRYLWLL